MCMSSMSTSSPVPNTSLSGSPVVGSNVSGNEGVCIQALTGDPFRVPVVSQVVFDSGEVFTSRSERLISKRRCSGPASKAQCNVSIPDSRCRFRAICRRDDPVESRCRTTRFACASTSSARSSALSNLPRSRFSRVESISMLHGNSRKSASSPPAMSISSTWRNSFPFSIRRFCKFALNRTFFASKKRPSNVLTLKSKSMEGNSNQRSIHSFASRKSDHSVSAGCSGPGESGNRSVISPRSIREDLMFAVTGS